MIFTAPFGLGQGTVPVFAHTAGKDSYTLLGQAPERGATSTIPVLLVPVALSLESQRTPGTPRVMDAASDVPGMLQSPVFAKFAFPGGATQYADALLRAAIAHPDGWHTLLGKPEVKPIQITVPAGYGYVLTSRLGGAVAVVDLEFVERQLFAQIPRQDSRLVIAMTRNTAFYALGDATVCCSWGTHGVDRTTGNSFVLGSYLTGAPAVVEDADVQPLTQQLAEFVLDPLHDPLYRPQRGDTKAPGNTFPAWMRPASTLPGVPAACGGIGAGSTYFLLEPTDRNPKNNFPASKAHPARVNGRTYHLQNAALLSWYTGMQPGSGMAYSFPDPRALTEPSKPCPARGTRESSRDVSASDAAAIPRSGTRLRQMVTN